MFILIDYWQVYTWFVHLGLEIAAYPTMDDRTLCARLLFCWEETVLYGNLLKLGKQFLFGAVCSCCGECYLQFDVFISSYAWDSKSTYSKLNNIFVIYRHCVHFSQWLQHYRLHSFSFSTFFWSRRYAWLFFLLNTRRAFSRLPN